MAVARLGLLFAGFLLLTSLVLILLGQAGLQARCKDLCVGMRVMMSG